MKRNSLKRNCWLLALCMLVPLLAGCSESKTNADEEAASVQSDNQPTAEDVAVTEEVADGREQYAPDLPEKNYEGFSFRIMSRDDSMHTYPVHTRDLWTETMNGEALNDAVYARNAKIEETYGVKFVMFT